MISVMNAGFSSLARKRLELGWEKEGAELGAVGFLKTED
jgi:hypothetical protein